MLVFLHGWTMDGEQFKGQFERLSDRFHCLAPDLPGHGTARHAGATLHDAAELVHELVVSRNLKDVILIGWSMGAAVAWHYVSCFGQSGLAGLMTVDMSPKIVNERGWTLGLKGQTRAATEASTKRLAKDWTGSAPAIAAGMFADRTGPPQFDFAQAVRKIAANDPAAMIRMWISLVAMDARTIIPRIEVPYLVAHGGLSRAYPQAAADWLVSTAPQARKHTFTRSGHAPHLEEPDAFADVVADFAMTCAASHHAAHPGSIS